MPVESEKKRIYPQSAQSFMYKTLEIMLFLRLSGDHGGRYRVNKIAKITPQKCVQIKIQ